jgi:hypothetical protein
VTGLVLPGLDELALSRFARVPVAALEVVEAAREALAVEALEPIGAVTDRIAALSDAGAAPAASRQRERPDRNGERDGGHGHGLFQRTW